MCKIKIFKNEEIFQQFLRDLISKKIERYLFESDIKFILSPIVFIYSCLRNLKFVIVADFIEFN